MFKLANNAICAWDRSVWGRMATSDHGLNPSWCYTALTRWQHNHECHPINVEMKTCHLDPCLLELDWLPVGQCCPADGGIGSVILAGWRSGISHPWGGVIFTCGGCGWRHIGDRAVGGLGTSWHLDPCLLNELDWLPVGQCCPADGGIGSVILAGWRSGISHPWGGVIFTCGGCGWRHIGDRAVGGLGTSWHLDPCLLNELDWLPVGQCCPADGGIGSVILAGWRSGISHPWGGVIFTCGGCGWRHIGDRAVGGLGTSWHLDPCWLNELDWLPVGQCCPADGGIGSVILAGWRSGISHPWGGVIFTCGGCGWRHIGERAVGGLGCLGDRFCRSSDWWWNGVQTWRIQAGGHTICMTEGVQGVTGDL